MKKNQKSKLTNPRKRLNVSSTKQRNLLKRDMKLNCCTKVAMSEQYSLHDILQRDLGARREPRKFPLVFVNPAGSEYKNGPTMISQEIFLLSETSCAICMALSSNYNCAFAADMTQAMAFLMDQDIFIKYPEAIDRATLELIC